MPPGWFGTNRIQRGTGFELWKDDARQPEGVVFTDFVSSGVKWQGGGRKAGGVGIAEEVRLRGAHSITRSGRAFEVCCDCTAPWRLRFWRRIFLHDNQPFPLRGVPEMPYEVLAPVSRRKTRRQHLRRMGESPKRILPRCRNESLDCANDTCRLRPFASCRNPQVGEVAARVGRGGSGNRNTSGEPK